MNENTYSPNGCVVGKHYDDDDDNWKVTDGRDLPKSERTEWRAGGTAKVAFTTLFNHGVCVLPTRQLCPS